MLIAFLLMLSGALIGAGLSILLRDIAKGRRSAFLLSGEARSKPLPDIEITIAQRGAGVGELPLPAAVTVGMPEAHSAKGEPAHTGRPLLEQQWIAIEPAIEAAVKRINSLLAPQRLSIGAADAAAWSYKNRSYGTYRRLLQDCDSIAWLRLELSAEGRLNADLKAHSDARAGINASLGEMADNLDATRVGKLLLNCLRPLRSSLARPQGRAHASGSERGGQDVDGVIGSALKATNGALLQAGAQIVPLAPAAWEPAPRQRRMTLRVEVNGNDVAHMHIERLGHAMQVAVGVHDASLVALGRRRSLPLEGMTVHALAELIAGCAWPAIARFKQVRGSA